MIIYTLPLRQRIVRWLWPILKLPLKLLVLVYAVRGRYPAWMVTPDDPVSPFGKGEPTVVEIYKAFGRYVGDVYWLAWRNANYGYLYSLKPDWLKDPAIRYEDLHWMEADGSIYLEQPDRSWLRETTRKIGPFYLITGWRIGPAYRGALENRQRLAHGLERAPRPPFHPNMDGRPVFSIRTKRTL